MTEKEKKMRAVYTNGFAVDEARLFLDTHPTDPEALAYYEKKLAHYQAAVDHYTEEYGPLTPKNGVWKGRWAWAEEPWPWEGGM